jgi:hypothetical protein
MRIGLVGWIVLAACGSSSSMDAAVNARPDAGVPDAYVYLPCDTVMQDCTASTDKCTDNAFASLYPSNRHRVCAQAGAQPVGTSCSFLPGQPATLPDTRTDDCQRGLFCDDAGGHTDGSGTCRKFCHGQSDCGTDEACFWVEYDATEHPADGVCRKKCAVFGNDCGSDQKCNPDSSSTPATGTCGAAGSTVAGDRCGHDSDCAQNTGCFGTGSVKSTCRQYCDLPAAGAQHVCPAGTNCVDITPPVTGVGICL